MEIPAPNENIERTRRVFKNSVYEAIADWITEGSIGTGHTEEKAMAKDAIHMLNEAIDQVNKDYDL